MKIRDLNPGDIAYFPSPIPKPPKMKWHLFVGPNQFMFINTDKLGISNLLIPAAEYGLDHDSFIECGEIYGYRANMNIPNDCVKSKIKKELACTLIEIVKHSLVLTPFQIERLLPHLMPLKI